MLGFAVERHVGRRVFYAYVLVHIQKREGEDVVGKTWNLFPYWRQIPSTKQKKMVNLAIVSWTHDNSHCIHVEIELMNANSTYLHFMYKENIINKGDGKSVLPYCMCWSRCVSCHHDIDSHHQLREKRCETGWGFHLGTKKCLTDTVWPNTFAGCYLLRPNKQKSAERTLIQLVSLSLDL